MPTLNCAECGNSFERLPNQNRRLYCSKSCRWKHDNEKVATLLRGPKPEDGSRRAKRILQYRTTKCLWCGTEFVHPAMQYQEYCTPVCRRKAWAGTEKGLETKKASRDRDLLRWEGERREKGNERRIAQFQQERLEKPWKHLLKNAQERSVEKLIPFDLTEEWAADRWTGACEITGIEFKLGQLNAGPKFYSPSIDRIFPNLGYVQKNCQFVLWAYNSCKYSATSEESLEQAKRVVLHRDKQYKLTGNESFLQALPRFKL